MLKGNIDQLTRGGVAGWAFDTDKPDQAVTLILTCNDAFVARIVANRFRDDLRQAKIGEGRHGFQFAFPEELAPFTGHSIGLRREQDGAHVPSSPMVLRAITAFAPEERETLSRLLRAETDGNGLDERINFLAEHLELLVARRASLPATERQRRQLRYLARRPDNGAAIEAAPLEQPRALIIDDWIPTPDRDAGSNAMLSHARSLQRLGLKVEFVAARELDVAPAKIEALSAFDIETHASPFCASVEEVLRRRPSQFDLIYLHRVQNAARYGALVRDSQPRARVVYSVADLHHLRVDRQAEVEKRPELLPLARRLRLAEMTAAATSDVVITHSDLETELLRKAVPSASIETVLWSVPLRTPPAPFAQRNGMAFIGGFGHDPNRDAVRWIVSEIMPRLRRIAAIECQLVGSNLPEDLARLCGGDIRGVGHVQDLQTVFDQVRLTIAPLAYGAGVKGKVLESMAAGIPCVCTPVAAEGLAFPSLLSNYVTADVDRFVEMIAQLHQDAELNAAVGEAGRAFVAANCSEASVDEAMKRGLGQELVGRSEALAQT